MTRKSITTSHAAVACDVCGRTLLRGENAGAFIAGGSRRLVCELCTARAANEGWIREGIDDALGVRAAGARGRSLLGRLRHRREAEEERVARRERRGYEAPPPAAAPAPRARVADGLDGFEPDDVAFAGAATGEPVPAEPPPAPTPTGMPREPAADGRAPRSVQAIPTNAHLKMARALDVFNGSEHPKKVAGVARSLGVPIVAVRPSTSEGSIVTIVVGWELWWYRFEVDLADEAAGVRITAQGAELSELSLDEQTANAAADDHGALVLAA